jgi:DNA polymerase-3 subunit delta
MVAKRVSSFAGIQKSLQSKGLFQATGTYFVDNDKEVLEMDVKKLPALIGKNTVIFAFDKIDGRMKFFKDAKAAGYLYEFPQLSLEDAARYIESKAFIDMRPEAADLLASLCGASVAHIDNELHKLHHLGQPVTYKLIEELVAASPEDQIFAMVDAIVKGNEYRTYELYTDLIELKESPIKMVSLLFTKFKQLIQVASMQGSQANEISGRTGMTFYQVKMAQELLPYCPYNDEQLLEILLAVQQLEMDMKTGKVDQFLGMETLLMDILEK